MTTQGQERHSHTEAASALADINKKTGRNMPQAVLTAVILIAAIVACLMIRIELFVFLVIFFMLLALRELHVDFASVHLYVPLVTLWVCCTGTLIALYYAPNHLLAAGLGIVISVLAVTVAASARHTVGRRLASAIEDKRNAAASASVESVQSKNVRTKPGSAGENSFDNVAVSIFIVLYVLVLASCIILPETFNGHPVAHVVMVIFLPALSDTGGLLAGAFFGKHKLSPRISPKKSVEGLIGSILFAMAGALVVFAVTYPQLWSSRWWVPVLAGVMVGIVGTFGDLCASMLKRDMGIKDMGHLLKGHGGVMDRVDSILLCAPFFVVLLSATGL
ncbi:phosphatidate cytidylyltransferase [Bifidobacterium bohemicum]|uniref:Phosphatidate cytidylyltransferase n=1 Tax=Bifidobacterium bohemicum DSM 22767 TaxID=1437606 RepID=A0A086ZJA6_9BIFI|nr:phosphatidate cytidylyltransferase [Bifidobacterium bohemicum]KFI46606.1 phosphatidate cytidylyltransferase [Bifidobacterium bohemicum DSM 22767]SCB76556.1 phosphatidate cytidylyltransferase [Bifidobacterium bohemicum]